MGLLSDISTTNHYFNSTCNMEKAAVKQPKYFFKFLHFSCNYHYVNTTLLGTSVLIHKHIQINHQHATLDSYYTRSMQVLPTSECI